jgi:hypothetical protein
VYQERSLVLPTGPELNDIAVASRRPRRRSGPVTADFCLRRSATHADH